MVSSDMAPIFRGRYPYPEREAQMPDDSKDQVQISARMPADLVSALEQRAEKEDRTLSAELRRAIRHYLTGLSPEAGAA
jgi:hypothetical protein